MSYLSSVLFIGDTSKWSRSAGTLLGDSFDSVTAIFWDYGSPKPIGLETWEGDWIICFKSDLILKPDAIRRAKKGVINIHPAPPTYRGIGGYYYSIANKDAEYGVTSHFIDNKIDHGDIISVLRFKILTGETPDTLSERTASYCLEMLDFIISCVKADSLIKSSSERWCGPLRTRNELKQFLEKSTRLNAA